MTPCDELWVRVNDELVLDAGTCEEVSGPRGPERLIRSPQTTLSQQVLAYLHAKPAPPRRPSGSMVGRAGVSRPPGATLPGRARAAAERRSSRVLANALVNTAWRKGPVGASTRVATGGTRSTCGG